MKLAPGAVLNRKYQIEKELGSGGMGTVYTAIELGLLRTVAIKVLHEQTVHAYELARFEREGRALASMDHINIIRIYAFSFQPPFLVMEYLEGETLTQLLVRRFSLPGIETLGIVLQIAAGMSYAHSQGIVHRDLKPQNILLTDVGGKRLAKILDFGLCRSEESGNNSKSLTGSNCLIGSPVYMCPEGCSGRPQTPKSDIYSLGVLFYETLTGAPPYSADSPIALMFKHVNEDFPALEPRFPLLSNVKQYDKILSKCMAKNPDHRYESMKDLYDALLELSNDVKADTDTDSEPDDDESSSSLKLNLLSIAQTRTFGAVLLLLAIVIVPFSLWFKHQGKTSAAGSNRLQTAASVDRSIGSTTKHAVNAVPMSVSGLKSMLEHIGPGLSIDGDKNLLEQDGIDYGIGLTSAWLNKYARSSNTDDRQEVLYWKSIWLSRSSRKTDNVEAQTILKQLVASNCNGLLSLQVRALAIYSNKGVDVGTAAAEVYQLWRPHAKQLEYDRAAHAGLAAAEKETTLRYLLEVDEAMNSDSKPGDTYTLTEILMARNKLDEANSLCLRELQEMKTDGRREDPDYAALLQQTAKVLKSERKYAAAEKILKDSRELIIRIGAEPYLRAEIETALAECQIFGKGRIKSLELLQDAEKEFGLTKRDKRGERRYLPLFICCYFEAGDRDSSVRIWKLLHNRFGDDAWISLAGTLLRRDARGAYRVELTDAAKIRDITELFLDAEPRHDSEYTRGERFYFRALSSYYLFSLNNFEETYYWTSKLLKDSRIQGGPNSDVETYLTDLCDRSNYGCACEGLGKYSESLSAYLNTCELIRKLSPSLSRKNYVWELRLSRTLYRAGRVEQRLGTYADAIRHFKESFQCLNGHTLPRQERLCILLREGACYLKLGDCKTAQARFNEAQKLYPKLDPKFNDADSPYLKLELPMKQLFDELKQSLKKVRQ